MTSFDPLITHKNVGNGLGELFDKVYGFILLHQAFDKQILYSSGLMSTI